MDSGRTLDDVEDNPSVVLGVALDDLAIPEGGGLLAVGLVFGCCHGDWVWVWVSGVGWEETEAGCRLSFWLSRSSRKGRWRWWTAARPSFMLCITAKTVTISITSKPAGAHLWSPDRANCLPADRDAGYLRARPSNTRATPTARQVGCTARSVCSLYSTTFAPGNLTPDLSVSLTAPFSRSKTSQLPLDPNAHSPALAGYSELHHPATWQSSRRGCTGRRRPFSQRSRPRSRSGPAPPARSTSPRRRTGSSGRRWSRSTSLPCRRTSPRRCVQATALPLSSLSVVQR